MMKKWYKIAGLSKPHRVTLENGDNLFLAESILTESKFNELFNYFKGDWSEAKYGLVEFMEQSKDGTPLDGMVSEISLTPN